jgi:predicted PhzF superfamily epimerase YddE/YHI9
MQEESMKLDMYQVDAFADELFSGNPAAVVPLEDWIPDEVMQAIAQENNLSETAFFVPEGDGFRIRWFTPTVEVELCGHATLASAHVLFVHRGFEGDEVSFQSCSGSLRVGRDGEMLVLDFPSKPPVPCPPPQLVIDGLGVEPQETLVAANYLAVFGREEEVSVLRPDFRPLARLGERGLIVTAPGDRCDFVSRYFAPSWGIDEDPATGSTHCELTPYWAQRLGSNRLSARQLSKRGARLECELRGERVAIGGRAVTFLTGSITTTR